MIRLWRGRRWLSGRFGWCWLGWLDYGYGRGAGRAGGHYRLGRRLVWRRRSRWRWLFGFGFRLFLLKKSVELGLAEERRGRLEIDARDLGFVAILAGGE